MALKGNLRDFSTTQILNLVNLARKTGALTIDSGGDTALLYFRDGKLIHASTKHEEGHLANMLMKAGKLSSEQVKAIHSQSGNISDKDLGRDLIRASVVGQEDIVQSVKEFMLDIVYSLFTWEEGQFHFDQGVQPNGDRITIPLNLDNVIMEGSRRIQLHERLIDELPDLTTIALKITDKPLKDIKLTQDDWRVISHIHPRNTVMKIAQANNMDEFQIRKIVYGMHQAGLVEIIRPEGMEIRGAMPAARAGRAGVDRSPAVKRGVVERLIGRIKRI
ncbi:MAG: DUF4388 domain-containing protein [Anaerolineae bacterium]